MAEFRTVYFKKANRYEAGLHLLSVSILGWDILYVVMGIIVVHQHWQLLLFTVLLSQSSTLPQNHSAHYREESII